MILHPGILSLLVSSLLVGGMVLYAAFCGIGILRGWDISSGSERQLMLERKTYLVSTILGYLLFFQLISLFLFIYTADDICPLFTGAMCAVGTLTVNPFGYPVLLCKIATFILAGLWLILNYADSRGYDYPLVRIKYWFLLFLAPVVVVEAIMQWLYFLGLRPDVITSCCGSLFSSESAGVAAEIASLPAFPMMGVFYFVMVLTLVAGVLFYRTGKGGWDVRGFERHFLRCFHRIRYFFHLSLLLRTANPPLPVLHPPKGIRLRGLSSLHLSPGRHGCRTRHGDADAFQENRQPGRDIAGAAQETCPCFSPLLSPVYRHCQLADTVFQLHDENLNINHPLLHNSPQPPLTKEGELIFCVPPLCLRGGREGLYNLQKHAANHV